MTTAITEIRFFQSCKEIANAYPTLDAQLKYKMLLDVAKRFGERSEECARAEIETQATLADSIDEALQSGDVRAERNGKEARKYTVCNLQTSIDAAEVDRWRKLRSIPEESRQEFYQSKKVSRNALLKWWKERQSQSVVDGCIVSEDKNFCLTDDLSTLSGKKFGTIYADPPWSYSNQGTRAATGNHYGTMSVADICNMPIAELAADDAHLHLWTTNAFLRDAFDVIEAWGFEYKSCAVWCKPQMGIGNYVRVSHEFLMIAVRGNAKSFKQKNIMSWFEHPRGKHSAKPDYWRKVIEANSPGPRLELFGRNEVEGWTIFGNQISTQKQMAFVS